MQFPYLFQSRSLSVAGRSEPRVFKKCDSDFPADQGHGLQETHGECYRSRAQV